MNQTGHFPVTCSWSNKYMMVLYEYDRNIILLRALQNRTKEAMLATYKELHTLPVIQGFCPKVQHLDNEVSDALILFIEKEDVNYQLVPAHNHWKNVAEQAIRTWKNHFLAGLSSADTNFPMHVWHWLIDQEDRTLNLLRPSHINPTLPAYNMIWYVFEDLLQEVVLRRRESYNGHLPRN